jgi:hypothetical protein
VTPFVLILPALGLGALLVLAAPETRPAARPRPRYRPQRPGLPGGSGGRFAAAAVCGVLSFSVFGMYASIVPSIIAGTLGYDSRVLAGAAAFAVFGCSLLSQLATRGLGPRRGLALGFAAMATGVTVTALSVRLASPSLALFLAGGTLAGGGAGLLFRGGLTTVVELSRADRRAEGLAGFFLVSYLGLAAPVIALGIATQALGAPAALAGFAALAVAAICAAARPLLRPLRTAT